MQNQSSAVVRQSIRFSPHSNTELNGERLPDPKSLAGMELRFRAESGTSYVLERYPAISLIAFSSFGCLMAFACFRLPQLAQRLLHEANSIEGMPVIAGMVAGLMVIIAALLLVFVPKDIRRGLASMLFPMVVIAACPWCDRSIEASFLVAFTALFGAFACRGALQSFYRSWLSADARMSTALAVAWAAGTKRGWILPSLQEAARVVERFLTYDSPQAGTPGVWIAPVSRSMRISVSALLAGSVYALMTAFLNVHLSLPVSFLIAISSSILPLIGVTVWAAGEVKFLTTECDALLQGDQRSPFERISSRLRDSQHVAADAVTGAPISEAAHLFLGAEPWQNFPILLHEPMLYEHVHISGRTGSGKTSMGLMQQVIQLIRGHRTGCTWSDKLPVIIIDLKGDEVLFQTAKAEAEARGQKFRFFTLEPGKASFYFNPFIGFQSATLTVPQLVHLNLDALDLYHGTGYGRGYYSQRSRFLLSQALRNPVGIDSFKDLYARLKTLYSQHPDDFRDAFELLSVVESLTFYDQLVTSAAQELGDETIRLDRVLEDREVVYFWLPSVKESATVAQVGKLLLFNLRTAADDRQSKRKEKRQAFLIIDEFQKLAGENFQQILQQARSAGIAAILANQSLSDLKTPDWDLTPTIRTNTRTKLYFSITEPEEIQIFKELSGEELQTFGMNDTEQIRLRLSTKELVSLSDHPKRLLLQVSSGSGYTQFGGLPIPVETDWPISKALTDNRAAMPWPSSPVIVKATPKAKPQKIGVPVSPAVSPQMTQQPSPTVQPVPAPLTTAQSAPVISTVAPAPSAQVKPKANPAKPPSSKPTTSALKPRSSNPSPTLVTAQTKKSPKPTPTHPAAKSKPAPAVKQAFAQKIQNLMND